MATHIKISGAAPALLALAALLAAGARADSVTTAECRARNAWQRPRLYPDSEATWLSMIRCGLTKIDPDVFTGLPNLRGVYLDNNNIEKINPAVFHTVPALTDLWLDHNKLRELPVFDERACANWTVLELSYNKLRVIDNADTFSGCRKLQRLYLGNNGIEFIHPNSFDALTYLSMLFLSDNKIRFVPELTRNKLRALELHNNRITHLPPEFASSRKRAGAGLQSFYFYGNPWHCACFLELFADVQRAGAAPALLALAALLAAGARADSATTAECRARGAWLRPRLYPDSEAGALWMDSCSLTKIDPDVFTGLPNLKGVYLYNNNIANINPTVFHTVPALTELRLHHNKLHELPVFHERACANWTRLDLSYNKLRVIDNAGTVSACRKLEILNLADNGIEFIHPNAFHTLTNLITLFLDNNKIRFVPEQLLARNDKLTDLRLDNNRITHLPPEFASSRKRAGAGLKVFYFHGNPWHCACLLELLADVYRAGVFSYEARYDIPRYDGTLPECNFIGVYPCRRDAPSGLLHPAPRAAQGGR